MNGGQKEKESEEEKEGQEERTTNKKGWGTQKNVEPESPNEIE